MDIHHLAVLDHPHAEEVVRPRVDQSLAPVVLAAPMTPA
ncbi:hypothetical protein STRIP9103_02049 [Streptomyces ipomoeae 91-03]|uniref:Uncharacterized protein n=1 Tax=Streptomyces ipomoeae 91-03 TaxID=698759 RepID=L1KVY0_9ACTN|nr:hypothetical protein STRIP9103_02049 [Streptomyces ipomoeae 91-03]